MLVTMGEGSGTPTEPHHTPSPEAPQHETFIVITSTYKPASPLGYGSQREAFPTVSDLEAEQDRETIIKTSSLPHDSTPKVTSLAADEGNGGVADQSRDDAPIKGRSLETGEETGAERGSDDTEELVNVLTSLDAAKILTSGGVQVSIPPAGEIPTGSGVVPTASPIFTTASMVTPYTRRRRKEKMVESETLQEQMDVQMRRLEEEMARDAQRMNEQIARDAEIAKIHAVEELQMLIDELNRSNEIDLINELVKYQDHHTKILKYQAQQSKPLTKKHQREFYTSVLRNHVGWKAKHFKGMILEVINEKFDPVWKQIQDFIPISSKEEGERFKRKGIILEHDSAKKVKTSEEVPEENLKEMMQLIPVEEVYIEALQVKHPIIDWEIHTEGQRSYWKIIRLGGSSASYQFFVDMLKHFDMEDLNQLWVLVKETLSISQPPVIRRRSFGWS
nr:hypothetical protein [Tanacetum cinerariifolium]